MVRGVDGVALLVALTLLACSDSATETTGPSCAISDLCEPVYVDELCSYCNTQSCEDNGDEPHADQAAVRCVLEALRDRRPGRVSLTRSGDATGYCGTSYGITIIEDGTGWVATSTYEDLDIQDDAFLVTLLPVDSYQVCLDAGPEGAMECLRSEPYNANSSGSCPCAFCDTSDTGDDGGDF